MTDRDELVVRSWRITRGDPEGCHLWFDPRREDVRLYRLPPPVGVVDITDVRTGLAQQEGAGYLAKVGSVSASGPGLAKLTQEDFDKHLKDAVLEVLPLGLFDGDRDDG